MDDEPYFSDELLFRMPFLRKIDGSFQLDLLPIITHHYKVNSFQEGFDVMRSGASGKVILDWE